MRSKFKRNIDNKKGDPNAWMLTLADLMSLLLCFFVLLFSMNSILPERWKSYKNELAKFTKSTSNIISPFSTQSNDFLKLNRKKLSNHSYDFGYIKNLFSALPENLNLPENVYVMKQTSSELKIFISSDFLFQKKIDDVSVIEITSKGKNLVFEMAQILNSLSNSFWIGSKTGDYRDALTKADFVAGRIENLGTKFTIPRKIFAKEIFSSKNDFHFDNDYIVVIIKSYEANI